MTNYITSLHDEITFYKAFVANLWRAKTEIIIESFAVNMFNFLNFGKYIIEV